MLRLLVLIFAFTFSLNNLAFSSDDYLLNKEAVKLLKEKKFDFAFLRFQKLLRNFPNSKYSEFAQLEIAKYYFNSNDLYNSKIEFEKLIKTYPKGKYSKEANVYLKKIDAVYLDNLKERSLRDSFTLIERFLIIKDFDNMLKECDKINAFPNLTKEEILKLKPYYLLCANNYEELKNKPLEKSTLLKALKHLKSDKEISERLVKIDEGLLEDLINKRDFASAKKIIEESYDYNPKAGNLLLKVSKIENNIKDAKSHLKKAENFIKDSSYENALNEYNAAMALDQYTAKNAIFDLPKKEIIEENFKNLFDEIQGLRNYEDYESFLGILTKILDENYKLIELSEFVNAVSSYKKFNEPYTSLIINNFSSINHFIATLEKNSQWELSKKLWQLAEEECGKKYFKSHNIEYLKELSFAQARVSIINAHPDGKIDDGGPIASLNDEAVMKRLMFEAVSELRQKGNALLENAKIYIKNKDLTDCNKSLEEAKLFIQKSEALESILSEE